MNDDCPIEDRNALDLVNGGSHDDDLLRFCRYSARVGVDCLPSNDDDLLRLFRYISLSSTGL